MPAERAPDPHAEFDRYVRSLSRWDRFVLRQSEQQLHTVRSYLATRYLRGSGLEIGALDHPVRLRRRSVRVEYADMLSRQDAAKLYGLREETLVEPTHILTADDLGAIPSGRFDFLISSHLIEHVTDPLAALEEWLRVLKPGGVLFLAIPNYRGNVYDYRRSPVRIDHVRDVAQRRGDPAAAQAHKVDHWREVVEQSELQRAGTPEFTSRLEQLVAEDFPIHYHVFDATSAEQLLAHVAASSDHDPQVLRRYCLEHAYELIFVLRRGGPVRRRPGRLRTSASSAGLLLSAAVASRVRRLRAR